MDFAVTGASGLIGSALVERLRRRGHAIRRLVRSRDGMKPGDVFWDPSSGEVDLEALNGVDGVVNLAGAAIGKHRWTESYRRTILESRVQSTRTIVHAMGRLQPTPLVLVSASAIGWYGDRGSELLTENSAPGSGFLADVTQAWEHEAMGAEDAGIRVVTARSGIVVSRTGGALGRLLPLVKIGAAGPLGPGRQWWSWITLEDEVRALQFLLFADETSGPVNLTAPQPVRQVELVNALARIARRPSFLPAPAPMLRLALGQMANEMVLASQRVLPGKLDQAGFDFIHDDVDAAASWVMRDD
jgi:uncharacterized protein (TIGR01777 family)